MRFAGIIKIAVVSVLSVLASACSMVMPQPMTSDALLSDSGNLLATAYDQLPEPGKSISMAEAQARALKLNHELRTRMMEETLSLRQLDVSRYDMLPTLVAQAGYNTRSNERINQSRDTLTGELAPSRFISQERSHTLSQLGLSWNLLDFGVSYYNARQQADRVNQAVERRRKMLHQVMQDVHIAYWRAAAAQHLRADLVIAIRDAESALMSARAVQVERVHNLGENLRYQRELLENLRLLEAIYDELATAQVELALLINVPAGYPLLVEDPLASDMPGLLELSVEQMEEIALGQNPDVLERHYDTRIARLETRKVLAQLFPNLRLDYGLSYDDDLYMVNNDWMQASAQLTYNLMDVLSIRARRELAQAGVDLSEQRLIMVQVATISQVHLGRLDLASSLSQLDRSNQLLEIDQRYQHLQLNATGVGTQSQLDMVVGKTSLLLSTLRNYQARAAAESANARLLFTLGADPKIHDVQQLSIEELMQQLQLTTFSSDLASNI